MDFLLAPFNALVGAFIDESQVCSNLPQAITGVGGIPLDCDCTAELASQGFLMVNLVASGTCTTDGLLVPITASATAESDAVFLWEPIFGGIDAFDPFTLSTDVDVLNIGGSSIESTATLFSDPPTVTLDNVSAVDVVDCPVTGLQFTCDVPVFGDICFDLSSFGLC